MPGRLIDTGSRAKQGDEFMMTKFETIQAISVPSYPEGSLFPPSGRRTGKTGK